MVRFAWGIPGSQHTESQPAFVQRILEAVAVELKGTMCGLSREISRGADGPQVFHFWVHGCHFESTLVQSGNGKHAVLTGTVPLPGIFFSRHIGKRLCAIAYDEPAQVVSFAGALPSKPIPASAAA